MVKSVFAIYFLSDNGSCDSFSYSWLIESQYSAMHPLNYVRFISITPLLDDMQMYNLFVVDDDAAVAFDEGVDFLFLFFQMT